MTSRPFIRRLAAVLAAATLAGCVANATVVDRHATAEQARDKAIVIVSVSHDRNVTGASARFFIDGGSPNVAKIESAAGPLELPIKNHFRDKYGHVYVLELPPGHHRFTAWSAHWRDRNTQPAPEGFVPLEFDAAGGDVVYIGNLHVTWSIGKGLLGNRIAYAASVAIKDNSKADLAIAERDTPAIAGRAHLALLPLGPWIKVPWATVNEGPEPTEGGLAPAGQPGSGG